MNEYVTILNPCSSVMTAAVAQPSVLCGRGLLRVVVEPARFLTRKDGTNWILRTVQADTENREKSSSRDGQEEERHNGLSSSNQLAIPPGLVSNPTER